MRFLNKKIYIIYGEEKMECKKFSILIDSYLREELCEKEKQEFEKHYFECDKCYLELKLNEKLHKKNVKIVLRDKKPRLVFKPLLIFSSFLIILVSSFFIIKEANQKHILLKISYFTPPVYIESETRNPSGNELFSQAMIYYNNTKFSKSLNTLNQIKCIDNNPKVLFFKGICYLLNDQYKNAIKNFNLIIKNANPSYYDEAIYYKGITLLRLNKKKEAIKLFNNLSKMFSPYSGKAKSILNKIDKI
jgi:tetratricopeptide (TPR) repeat protein